jgi:hypothetical protein
MYIASLGPDWKNTEVGQFLVASNLETARIAERIANEPTGYDIERVVEQVEETTMTRTKNTTLDEMIEALATKHGWGYRRIHSFLLVGGYNPPSLGTVQRRVRAIRGVVRS